MPARIDFATLDRLATASTRARLANLSMADLDRPSACSGWDIRTLLSHLVGGNIRFAQALRGEPADWPTRDAEPVASPLAEFDASAAEMASAVAGIDDPRRAVRLPAGEPPAAFAVSVHGRTCSSTAGTSPSQPARTPPSTRNFAWPRSRSSANTRHRSGAPDGSSRPGSTPPRQTRSCGSWRTAAETRTCASDRAESHVRRRTPRTQSKVPCAVTPYIKAARSAPGLPEFLASVHRLEFDRVPSHMLRYVAASLLMVAAGIDMAIVSKRLGHSTIEVTVDIFA